MGMEKTLVPGLLVLVKNLELMCENVPVQRPQCKMLAELVTGLTPLLEEIQTLRHPVTEPSVQTFTALMHALLGAQIVVKKIKECSKVEFFFRYTNFSGQLSEATLNIRACLSALPLGQLRISAEMREEIKLLNVKLEELGQELKESNSMRKEQQDLAAEVMDILRSHNTSEASPSAGAVKLMDKMIACLAQHFDSDVDTVRRQWQMMKEEAMCLRETLEFTSENKRQLEEELLQTLIYIDTEERQCPTCASRNMEDYFPATSDKTDRTEVEIPREFICPICLQTLVDPVITGTGFTYCKKCIANWFEENDTCPNTRRNITKITIDNMALSSLISRWVEISQGRATAMLTPVGIVSSTPTSSEAPVNQAVLEEFIAEQEVQSAEPVMSPTKFSSQSPSSSSSHIPVKSVTTYISLLGSKKSMQILKSLKELTSLCNFSKGQVQVFKAGGVPAVTELLKEKDTSITEKAVGVLEALTFDIKGDLGESTLPCEERDQICSAVTDIALGDLLDLMLRGSSTGRLKAAQAVINILGDEEIRAEVSLRSGVVTAFYGLISVGEGLIFPDEGRALCSKGLNLLSGENGTGSTEEVALIVVLLRLAASGVSPQVVEESLVALRSMVETGREAVCNTMRANKAVPFLVRSISRLPSGRGREDALKILNEMSLLDGMPEVIVKHELFFHLLRVLNEENYGDCVTEATRLLNTSLSSVKGDISHMLSQADLKGLVGLLGLERTSVASKVNILSSLEYLCRDSLPLRAAFLKSAGVAKLQVLVKTFETIEMKDGVARLMRILASFPTSRKEICNQGGLQLVSCLLVDDCLRYCTQAVMAAEFLMTSADSLTISLSGFPYDSVVALLGPIYELECREAAVGILSILASRDPDLDIHWDRKTVELLLDIVRPDDVPITLRKKAAETLVAMVKQASSVCTHLVKEDGLSVLIEFWCALGAEAKVMIIELLSMFCEADSSCMQAVLEVGGPKILLEGLEKGKMKETSAIAIRHLVESATAKRAVLQAGFIRSAVKCIQANGGNQCSVELTRALVAVLDGKANAESIREAEDIREADGVQALLSVLEGSIESGKKVAAIALTKLMSLDSNSSTLLGQAEGISSIYKFLVYQESDGPEQCNDMEALEALSVACEVHANKLLIVQEGAIPLLIAISTRGASRAQELALNILLLLSREDSPAEHDICGTLLKQNICKALFDIVQPQSQLPVTETAVYCAICIIRNLSLTRVSARTAMLEEGDGAIKVLLDRIRHHDANASVEAVRGAVIALERFVLHSRGKMALIREGGIRVIVQILHYRLGSGQAKSFATKILVMMAQDSQASREVCHAIFEADVIPGLRDILEHGPSSECKLQACTLLKFLMYAGPRAAVCKRIRQEQCIPKLLDLRLDIVCREVATGALDLLKTYDKESRKMIHDAHQQPNWSMSPILSA